MLGRSRMALGVVIALLMGVLIGPAALAQGPGNGRSNQSTAATTTQVAAPLSEAESDALLFMREEEKLAHDVYVTLGDKWGLAIFDNIAAAEQRHMDAVKRLIVRYGLTDPVSTNGVGVFTHTELQALYDELIARGMTSASEALRVGAYIEEVDIEDLKAEVAATSNADLVRLFTNLLNGSENHLRGFVRALEAQGESYEPTVLDAALYAEIMAGTNGNGGTSQGTPRNRGNRGNHNGQGNGPSANQGNGNGIHNGDGTCDHDGTGMGPSRGTRAGTGNGTCDGTCTR